MKTSVSNPTLSTLLKSMSYTKITAQQVNQTIIVAIKAMVYLTNLFSCKAIEIVGKLDT